MYQVDFIFQAKILYKDVPFPEDERENIKLRIQSNVYGYLGILLEGRERFEDESLAEMRKQRPSYGADSAGTFAYLFSSSILSHLQVQIIGI